MSSDHPRGFLPVSHGFPNLLQQGFVKQSQHQTIFLTALNEIKRKKYVAESLNVLDKLRHIMLNK